MKKGLILFLAVLLVLVGLPYAYLAFSSGSYDTAFTPAELPLMTAEERFLINSADKTVTVRLDSNDIYRMVYDDEEKALPELVNEALGEYGLTVKKLGVRFTEDGAHAAAKLLYKKFLPLPLNCDISLAAEGTALQFCIDRVSVGKLIKIDTSRFTEDLDLSYELGDLNPIFEEVRSVRTEEGALAVTIPAPLEWIMEGIETSPSDYVMINDFVSFDEVDTPVQALFDYTEGDPSGLETLLDSPEKLGSLKKDMLAIGGAYPCSIYFSANAPASNAWLFPDITKEIVEARREEIVGGYQALYDERVAVLDEAYEYLHECYADGRLVLKGGVLVFADNPKEPVDAGALEQLQGTEDWLDLDTVRIILGKNPGDYALRGQPGSTTPVLILKTRTGRAVVCLRKSSTAFLVQTVSPADYMNYMSAKKTPTHNIGIFTTQK